ncbi:MAG: hypothetical protein WAK17_21655 [Candidatus Nitrosopolaris sp.]|jgi:hypothetical protein
MEVSKMKTWNYAPASNSYLSLDGGTGNRTTKTFETRRQNSKGGENYILTSKPTSKKFIEPLATNPSKKRKIT